MTTVIEHLKPSDPVTQSAISVDRLTKRYGDRNVVDGLSFSIPRGVVTGFLGPNGSGKTTTIRMIFGLIHATAGTALVDGRPFAALPDPAGHAGILIDGGRSSEAVSSQPSEDRCSRTERCRRTRG